MTFHMFLRHHKRENGKKRRKQEKPITFYCNNFLFIHYMRVIGDIKILNLNIILMKCFEFDYVLINIL